MRPAWIIGGNDPSGNAGLIVDIKTFHAFDVPICAMPTALTAQDRTSVSQVRPVDAEFFAAQLRSVAAGERPAVIKTGLLGNAALLRSIVDELSVDIPLVADPVLAASSGEALLSSETLTSFRRDLFPRVTLLTPNIPEAEALLEMRIRSPGDVESAARRFVERGVRAVLLKGGHATGDYAADFWTDGKKEIWFRSPRQFISARGTGCTLASAIAAGWALGHSALSAICLAKLYLNRERRAAFTFPDGPAQLRHRPWTDAFSPEDLPTWSATREPPRAYHFEPTPNLGLYGIVDRFEKLVRLVNHGVRTVQLRVKDLRGRDLENEIAKAADFARERPIHLFINDYWELALKSGARGVHLGQEDLDSANLEKLRKAGLQLGISTHDYAELSRAVALVPSYVALGPIYPTTTKQMPFAPQGLATLRRFRSLVNVPLVAIGGVTLARTPAISETGVDGIAVLSGLERIAPSQIEHWVSLIDAGLSRPCATD